MLRIRRVRGFKLGRKLVRVFRWAFLRRKPTRYHPLAGSLDDDDNNNNKNRGISKLRKWGRSISRGAREICSPRSRSSTTPTANRILQSTYSNYIRVSHEYNDDFNGNPSAIGGCWRRKKRIGGVPKGHLAVYVGEEEKERVLVPVIYLNHPLFEKLLKEAEEVYGFDQPGRITIPCPISEFEHVQTEIAERDYSRRWRKHLNHHYDSYGGGDCQGAVKCLTI